MKKFILSFVAIITVLSVSSQTEKGSTLVGVGLGSLSYTNSKSSTEYSNVPTVYNSDGNSFSISANPNYAWFIKDNLALGGGFSVSMYTSKSNSSNTSNSNTSESKYNQPSIYVGPYVRYYLSGSKSGKPFMQANFQIGLYGGKSTSTTNTGASSETKTKPKGDWNAGATFGYEHFLSTYCGVYFSFGVNYGQQKTAYDYAPSTGTGYTYTSTYKRWYIPVSFGFQLHLPAKKKAK